MTFNPLIGHFHSFNEVVSCSLSVFFPYIRFNLSHPRSASILSQKLLPHWHKNWNIKPKKIAKADV